MRISYLLFTIFFVSSLAQPTNFLGVYTSTVITDPTFYQCIAPKIIRYHTEFMIIPYQLGFPDAIVYTNNAQFNEIHLIISPNSLKKTSIATVAQDIKQNIDVIGVPLSGVWLEVFNSNDYWLVGQEQNTELILGILDTLNSTLTSDGSTMTFGVRSTQYDWTFVTGQTAEISGAGYYYWSSWKDGFSCASSSTFMGGWQFCYFQEISSSSQNCGYSVNVEMAFYPARFL